MAKNVVELRAIPGGRTARHCVDCRFWRQAISGEAGRCGVTGQSIEIERSCCVDNDGCDIISCGPEGDWFRPRRGLIQWVRDLF